MVYSQTQGDEVVVVVEVGQSLRQISEKYLKNPDLWPYILTENGLQSPSDVVPGTVLRIPVKDIREAHESVEEANVLIQKAAELGAQVLAPQTQQSAIELNNNAKALRTAGKWKRSTESARAAIKQAEQAIKECEAQSNLPSQAEIEYRRGQVHKRTPADNVWLEALIHALLYEGDKVRTLSKSFAKIQFQDKTQLRLEENSEALIQRMRSNRLKKQEQSSIQLLEGDFFALLGGSKSKSDFQVKLEDVQTNIQSAQYRISRDKDATRFANYEGNIEVTSAGATVNILENQGSVVKKNQAPSKPTNLLPKPVLFFPPNESRLDPSYDTLRWGPVNDASMYLLEVAQGADLNNIEITERVLESQSKLPVTLPAGVYSWRVAAIDVFDLVGPSSQARTMFIVEDKSAPYLILYEPDDGQAIFQETVSIRGETEPSTKLTVNDTPVPLDKSGNFSFNFSLSEGWNELQIVTTDPAGNQTRKVRKVQYIAERGVTVKPDTSMVTGGENHFLVQQPFFTFSATTNPKSLITAKTENGANLAKVYSDENGYFKLTMPVIGDQLKFNLEVQTESGAAETFTYSVEVDQTPPVIKLESPLPNVTNQDSLLLTGEIVDGINFSINDELTPLTADRFHEVIVLQPGTQRIRLVSYDQARNVAVLEKNITLDKTPPVLLKLELSPTAASGGKPITVNVQAKDESGLKRTAAYTIQVGEYKHDGYLTLKGADLYSDTVTLPPNVTGAAKVTRIVLEDRLGNVAEITY